MQRDVDILLAQRHTLFPGEHINNPWLRLFLSHVALENDLQLEFSIKVRDGRAVSTRPTMGFVRQVHGHLMACLQRLEHYGAAFDPAPVRAFFEAVRDAPDRPLPVDLLIHGLELGDSPADTRIKLHVRFLKSSAIEKMVLTHPASNPGIAPFIEHARVTMGFDLFTGRRTTLRNYLSFGRPAQAQALFEAHFGAPLAAAMASAGNIWLAWKEAGPEPFIYFVDRDATRFIEVLGLRGVDPAHRHHRDRPAYIFGAPLRDLRARELREYNAYFMLPD